MNILLTGGTGFIGSALARLLVQDGHSLVILTRTPAQYISSDELQYIGALSEVSTEQPIHAVINLAGQPLNGERWNAAYKQALIDSRINTTRRLVEWIKQRDTPPSVLISGSAIGWYGNQPDKMLSESDSFSPGFTHSLCEAWEQEALAAESIDTRVCLIRTGIVLDQDGGPLAAMLLPFKLGIGGPMGSGTQWWSWIHREDLIRIIQFALSQTQLNGPINGTAPMPVPQQEFARLLGKKLRRPAFMPMPGWAAKLALGEFAEAVLLEGQAVLPTKMQKCGFQFHYPSLGLALDAIDV